MYTVFVLSKRLIQASVDYIEVKFMTKYLWNVFTSGREYNYYIMYLKIRSTYFLF